MILWPRLSNQSPMRYQGSKSSSSCGGRGGREAGGTDVPAREETPSSPSHASVSSSPGNSEREAQLRLLCWLYEDAPHGLKAGLRGGDCGFSSGLGRARRNGEDVALTTFVSAGTSINRQGDGVTLLPGVPGMDFGEECGPVNTPIGFPGSDQQVDGRDQRRRDMSGRLKAAKIRAARFAILFVI